MCLGFSTEGYFTFLSSFETRNPGPWQIKIFYSALKEEKGGER